MAVPQKKTRNAPKRKKRGPLSKVEKETVIQIYHTIGTYSGAAKKLGVSVGTVKRVMVEAESDLTLGAVRARAMTEVAGKVNGLTHMILDSIAPEELTTTHHKVYDVLGNLQRIVTEGPTLRDKAVAANVFINAQKTITETNALIRNPLLAASGDAQLMLPNDLDAAKEMLVSKIKRLRIMDVEFDTGETGQKIKQALNRHGISDQEVEDAEYTKSGPFD